MTESNLKSGLAQWAKKNAIRPVDFARAMGYTPAYGWSLLRGEADVTVEALGRFVLAYGPEATRNVMDLAGLPNVNLPHPDGAQVGPLDNVQA